MKIILIHQTIAEHDAIGNDIECMYHAIKTKNYVRCYADNQFNKKLLYINGEELDEIAQDKNNIVIYHHSVYWEFGEKLLNNCKARVIIRYHNITPARFFKLYNEHHYRQCELGQLQTIRFANHLKDAFWLCDSQFNSSDIDQIESHHLCICPPFNKIDEWAGVQPDENILKNLLYNRDINLLFVGRIAPNKGHLFLIDAINLFTQNYDCNIKLRIIGKFDNGLNIYNQIIKEKISEYELEDNIEFIGEINDSLLMSYYLGSDFFVCASEHEGFCVPIIESQYFMLPVIAIQSSAVTETIGKEQIILERDLSAFVAAIKVLSNNENYYLYLQFKGEENYHQRFESGSILNIFKSFMQDKLEVTL